MISDERFIKTHAILGASVVGSDGHKLGTIRELFLDSRTGSVAFAILEASGLFGGGGKFHPVPWRMLRVHPDGDSWLASFDRDRLKGSPAYDRDQLNSADYGWGDQTLRYFGADGASEPETVSVVTSEAAARH